MSRAAGTIADHRTPGGGFTPVGPPGAGERVMRWLRHASVSALAISLLLHVAGGVLTRFLMVGSWGGPGEAAVGGAEGPAELAMMGEAELAAIEAPAMSLETPAVPDALPQVMPTDLGAIEGGPVSEAGGGPDIGDVGALTGGGSSFFGVEAQGNRFAYIVDVSGSMSGPKLDMLKRELVRSIEGLLETSEFVVIQYSDPDNAKIVGEVQGWQQASPSGKRAIRAHVGLLEASGNTYPYPAFQLLAATRPRPDVVYFLTDGDFTDDPERVADDILRLVQPWKCPVHTICVDTLSSEQRMKRIARQTRGTYTFIRGGGP